MTQNITIRFSHPDAISNIVRYARVDNTTNPIYITVSPNPNTSPTVIATNIPAGQYIVGATPVYADGRACQESFYYTNGCNGLLSISAYISGNNLIVQYLAPYYVTKVKINVYYPNNGSSTANYVNTGNDIVIPLPNGVYGSFSVTGQSVCDEASQFYSPESNQVVINRSNANTSITNGVSGISITSVSGIAGFTLSQIVTTGNTVTGTHTAFYGSIAAYFSGTPGANKSATLSVNGTVIQCVAIPNVADDLVSFSAASFADSDIILVSFNNSTCP